jgi:probable F420-dependent oxidoreductase
VKIRIGISSGPGTVDASGLCALADDIERLGFDSLWMPEVLSMPGLDPFIGLSWVGAHNPKLKLGTTALLPGRNLIRLARQCAGLDALSDGRLLLTLVPGIPRGVERGAVGVAPAQRGSLIDEALPLLRSLWAGESVTYHGAAGDFDGVAISPRPRQEPLEVWLGGTAPAALERAGRLSDGWLPAMCSPAEVQAGRKIIEEVAGRSNRTISPEHFGVSIAYAREPLDAHTLAALSSRARGKPIEDLVPVGLEALRDLLHRFLDVEFSKFVVRPLRPLDWHEELEALAEAVGDLQT